MKTLPKEYQKDYLMLINLIKEHLIPYPRSADSRLWNERLGILIEDVTNFYDPK